MRLSHEQDKPVATAETRGTAGRLCTMGDELLVYSARWPWTVESCMPPNTELPLNRCAFLPVTEGSRRRWPCDLNKCAELVSDLFSEAGGATTDLSTFHSSCVHAKQVGMFALEQGASHVRPYNARVVGLVVFLQMDKSQVQHIFLAGLLAL